MKGRGGEADGRMETKDLPYAELVKAGGGGGGNYT